MFRPRQRHFGAPAAGKRLHSDHLPGDRSIWWSPCLLLHACGGVASGLGPAVPASGGRPRLPAAAAQRAVPGGRRRHRRAGRHHLAADSAGHTDIGSYATAGLLGLVLFTIAGAASFVASRMRESEALGPPERRRPGESRRTCRNTSCSTCAKACWSSTPPTRSASSTNRRPKFSATNHAVPGALVGEVSPRLLYSLETWRQSERGEDVAVELRGGGRRAADPAAFRAAGRQLARPHADFSGRHQSHGRARAAEQARGARPAVRQHRPRNPQSRRRHEPRRPTARRESRTSARTSAA